MGRNPKPEVRPGAQKHYRIWVGTPFMASMEVANELNAENYKTITITKEKRTPEQERTLLGSMKYRIDVRR